MFDISFGELMVIFIVALLVLGPERMPKVARMVGKMIGQLQMHAANLKQELAKEGELAELRKIHEETSRSLQEVGQQMIAPLTEAEQQLRHDIHQVTHGTVDAPLPDATITTDAQAVAAPSPEPEVTETTVAAAPLVTAVSQPEADVVVPQKSKPVDTSPAYTETQLDLFDTPTSAKSDA
ncbi:Sec-independent protein translocase protein TatB [Leeia oryzae]|uniref:Sec-independent protein translocase protein TatB n=1 Tax=Leeia oryzae TaxID=356662 RepID=UPI00037DF033|nr:Sec-independent protein translocase protein TatB [Leeia oryzae]